MKGCLMYKYLYIIVSIFQQVSGTLHLKQLEDTRNYNNWHETLETVGLQEH